MIPDDIEREMKIPPFTVPAFEPLLKPGDLDGIEDRDQKVLFQLSVITQKLDFCLARHASINEHLRYIEAEMIRQRRDQITLNWRWATISAVGVVAGAALLEHITKTIVKAIWP